MTAKYEYEIPHGWYIDSDNNAHFGNDFSIKIERIESIRVAKSIWLILISIIFFIAFICFSIWASITYHEEPLLIKGRLWSSIVQIILICPTVYILGSNTTVVIYSSGKKYKFNYIHYKGQGNVERFIKEIEKRM